MTISGRISHIIFGLTGLCFLVGSYTALGQSRAQASKEIVRSVALSSGGLVSIETFKGSVTVSTWDQSEVEIRAIVEADGRSRIREEAVEYTEIRIEDSPSSVFIESDYGDVQRNLGRDGGWGDDSNVTLPFVHYTIRMPKDGRLDINDHKSEISVDGLASEVRINSHKGPMNIKNVSGELRLETHKSRVRVSALSGALDLDTHEAEVDIEYAKYTARSRIETHKGDITLTIPKGSAFELDADVGNKGDLRADFDLRGLEHRFGRRDEDVEYRGAVNGGGPLLRLRTYKGYIRIRER